MLKKLLSAFFFLLPVALGLGATLYWLYPQQDGALIEVSLLHSALGLALVSALTCFNLGFRWFRWHFLTRRFGARLLTRESAVVYFATLPLILTPFYCGEAFRGLFFSRQNPRLRGIGVKVWLAERSADALALGVWALAGLGEWLGAGLALLFFWGATAWGLSKIEKMDRAERAHGGSGILALTLCGVTLVAWALPILALWGLFLLWGYALPLGDASLAFSGSTVAGALTGLPVGIGVSGSLAILWLELVEGFGEVLPWAIAVFRLGTVWFSVAAGVFLFLWWRKPLLEILRGEGTDNHFDDIAAVYTDEIPEHVKARLLDRKISLMAKALGPSREPQSLRGLDLGCGQGWYIAEMAKRGYRMAGVDLSQGQIDNARRHAAKLGVEPELAVATAAKIPFDDDSFDFVYSINVLHHILDDADRQRTFAEIIRVLRPGGSFFLHEMNTTNPLFRLYMSYVFPLINSIDEGIERWIMPRELPPVEGGRWSADVEYFTFVPDFIPEIVLRWTEAIERGLESSSWTRPYSAHYMAQLQCTEKAGDRVEHIPQELGSETLPASNPSPQP